MLPENDPRWQAVLGRDSQADGQFVFSVESTGVYCRPSCPARRPRPENVTFHPTCQAAEAAGFRPCRRCRPGETSPRHQLSQKVVTACRLLEAAPTLLPLAELASQVGLSPSHLKRSFQRLLGVTPAAYARALRQIKLREHLGSGQLNVTQALYAAGFGSSSRLYEQSSQLLGMTPAQFRQGGTGQTIRFALGQCSLGSILVASSSRGLCDIALGDQPDQLLRQLQDRFPQARLVGDDEAFANQVACLVGFLEAPTSEAAPQLPLDIQGTAFQKRVWEALQAIPVGQTVSYTELARRLGLPQAAARAVAGACAANRLALAIPCHRVVRQDGSLSGYRWGVERKGELLRREVGAVAPPQCSPNSDIR